MDKGIGNAAASRKQLEDELKALEQAKATTPSSSAAAHAALDADMARAKQQMIASKPPGVRLELCKQAVARARQLPPVFHGAKVRRTRKTDRVASNAGARLRRS